MSELLRDDLFSSRILGTEYDSSAKLAPVRDLARSLYQHVSTNSNQPIDIENLPGEKAAIELSVARLSKAPRHREAIINWDTMTPREKLEEVRLVAEFHINNLAMIFADEMMEHMSSKADRAALFTAPDISSIGYTKVAGSICINHEPPDEDNDFKAMNDIIISRVNGKSCVDEFNSAMETAFYIAARLHQTHLETIVAKTDLGDSLSKTARIFQFKIDLDPHEFDNGEFVWEPEEFDKWMKQPAHRHALSHVKAAMSEYNIEAYEKISDDFMENWRLTFFKGCLETVRMSNSLKSYDYKTQSSPKLDHLEKIVTLMKDDIRKIDANTLGDLHLKLQDFKKHKQLGPQIERVYAELMKNDPYFQYIDAEDNSKRPYGQRRIIKDDVAAENIAHIPHERLQYLEKRERTILLKKLFNIAANSESENYLATRLALRVEKFSMPFGALEDHEDVKIRRLADAVQNKPEFIQAKASWMNMSQEDKLSHLMKFATLTARIFESKAADQIATFDLSREKHEEMSMNNGRQSMYSAAFAATAYSYNNKKYLEKKYPGLDIDINGKHIIAINTNSDASTLTNYYTSLATVLHEQTHLHEDQITEMLDYDKLPTSDPYYKLADMIHLDPNPWRTKSFEDSHLTLQFYHANIRERHAYSLEAKFLALCYGEAMPREKQIVNGNRADMSFKVFFAR